MQAIVKPTKFDHWFTLLRIFCMVVILAAPLTTVVSLGRNPPLFKQMRYVMGTLCEIQVYDADEGRAEQAVNRAFEAMQALEARLTLYNEDSELSRINHSASRGPVPVSPELFDFLKTCEHFYHLTAGAFDPTVGPLVRAWKFLTPRPARPNPSVMAALRSKIGFDKIVLMAETHSIRLVQAGMEIDSGGIGKGYAVDRAAAILKEEGISSALVNAGSSSLYAIGSPPGQEGWKIGIKDPENPNRAIATVRLRDNSLSTSGSTEKFADAPSGRFSHIFDPRTGEPVGGIYEVSVIAPTATESDALTKVVVILSQGEAFGILRTLPNVHAFRVDEMSGKRMKFTIAPWSKSEFEMTHRMGER